MKKTISAKIKKQSKALSKEAIKGTFGREDL